MKLWGGCTAPGLVTVALKPRSEVVHGSGPVTLARDANSPQEPSLLPWGRLGWYSMTMAP